MRCQEVVALVISVGHDYTPLATSVLTFAFIVEILNLPYNRLQDRIHITLMAEL
jgi:hypothetical protein